MMKPSELTRIQQPVTNASNRVGASREQLSLNRLREAVAPVLNQSREGAVSPSASFGSGGDCHPNSGVEEFLGGTRYFGQNRRGQLTPVPIPPRNAEDVVRFQWDGSNAYDSERRLIQTRRQIETLRRADNGADDLNPQRGVVVVQSQLIGARTRTPVIGSLNYDQHGNVNYERRIGPAGRSHVETYRGKGPRFRYEERREGQIPNRVIETTRDGLVRSRGFSGR